MRDKDTIFNRHRDEGVFCLVYMYDFDSDTIFAYYLFFVVVVCV